MSNSSQATKSSSSSQYSDKRRRLYGLIFDEYHAQYINYEKYYLASDVLANAQKALNLYSTVMGAALLVLIQSLMGETNQESLVSTSLLVAASISAVSFLAVYVDWGDRSSRYYREGQEHQDLYKEFNHLVKVRMPDPSESDQAIEVKYEELVERKNELNKETSKLASRWYKILAWREDLDWEKVPLEDLK